MNLEEDVQDPWLMAWKREAAAEDGSPRDEPYYTGPGGAKWDQVDSFPIPRDVEVRREAEHLKRQVELLNERIADLEEELDAERGANFGLRSMCRRLSDGMTALKREFDKWSKWDVET